MGIAAFAGAAVITWIDLFSAALLGVGLGCFGLAAASVLVRRSPH